MIIQEQIENSLVRTYSDNHVYIRGGFPEGNYIEAIDPIRLNRIYVETDIPIIDDNQEENDEYAIAGRILMGVDE